MTKTIADSRTVIPAAPPANWETEIPRYRATRAVHPSPNDRHRHEPPFSSSSDPDAYQYGTRLIKAREEFETCEWPHESFWPLNFSAKRTLDFFRMRQRSRLPRSPWANGRIRLEDGLGGPTPRIAAPKPERVDLQPRQVWPGL